MKLFISAMALFLFAGCVHQDDYYNGGDKMKTVGDFFTIENISDTVALADSLSTVLIKVKVKTNNSDTSRNVTFQTSLGKFSNGTQEISVKTTSVGFASATLFSNEQGDATVTVTDLNLIIDTIVHFRQAPPDDLILTANEYVVDSTQTISLTCFALRDRGVVTDGVKINFKVVDKLDSSLSLVVNPISFTKARKAVVTVSNPFHLHGKFIAEAWALKTDGTLTKATAELQIK